MSRLQPKAISGARWNKMRRRVLRSETHCAICGQWVDQSLPWLDPMAPQVDHRIPVDKGGDPWARENLTLVHRRCNRAKSNNTATPLSTVRPW